MKHAHWQIGRAWNETDLHKWVREKAEIYLVRPVPFENGFKSWRHFLFIPSKISPFRLLVSRIYLASCETRSKSKSKDFNLKWRQNSNRMTDRFCPSMVVACALQEQHYISARVKYVVRGSLMNTSCHTFLFYTPRESKKRTAKRGL